MRKRRPQVGRGLKAAEGLDQKPEEHASSCAQAATVSPLFLKGIVHEQRVTAHEESQRWKEQPYQGQRQPFAEIQSAGAITARTKPPISSQGSEAAGTTQGRLHGFLNSPLPSFGAKKFPSHFFRFKNRLPGANIGKKTGSPRKEVIPPERIVRFWFCTTADCSLVPDRHCAIL